MLGMSRFLCLPCSSTCNNLWFLHEPGSFTLHFVEQETKRKKIYDKRCYACVTKMKGYEATVKIRKFKCYFFQYRKLANALFFFFRDIPFNRYLFLVEFHPHENCSDLYKYTIRLRRVSYYVFVSFLNTKSYK